MKKGVVKMESELKKELELHEHEDDEWYDEVRIKVVPRYKTSELSGDEWRVSAQIELLRKGKVQFERTFTKLQYAIMALPYVLLEAWDHGREWEEEMDRGLCMQPGCSEKAVSVYQYKKFYDRDGNSRVPSDSTNIKFCQRHLQRGDCGLQDADENYEVVSGPGPEDVSGWEGDESPAVFGGVIEVQLKKT